MNRSYATCAACALVFPTVGSALARGLPHLQIELSHDQSQWHDDISQSSPGETIYVRVLMTIPDSYYGVAGGRWNIASSAGQWDTGGDDTADLTPAKGSTSDGRVHGFDFGGQTQIIFEAGNRLRIDAKGDNGDTPNAGISTGQNTPTNLGAAFNTNKTVEVYRFSVAITAATMAANGGFVRLIIGDGINDPINQITSFKGYLNASSTAGTQIDGATGDTAIISIPAPGAAPVGLMLAAGIPRRRRR